MYHDGLSEAKVWNPGKRELTSLEYGSDWQGTWKKTNHQYFKGNSSTVCNKYGIVFGKAWSRDVINQRSQGSGWS